MKRGMLPLLVVLATIALLLGPWAQTVSAQATPQEIEAAIVKGLARLAAQQNADGSWAGGCESVAYTGLAVLKFETRAIELGLDPLGSNYQYAANVKKGLDYIMPYRRTQPINPQPAGNPDGDGDGIGVYFVNNCGYHQIYTSGVVMMALAASGHPETYKDVLQDAVDYMAWSQADAGCGLHQGGWRYAGNNECQSDNSNAGYVTLGLAFAQAPPPYGFGLTVPDFVKRELSLWIDTIQDDVNGDTHDGGSYYEPYCQCWVNILKTGNLIFEMVLVGDTAGTPRLRDAVDYIERHWKDQNVDPGWGYNVSPVNYQAIFILKKGLDFAHIPLIDLDNNGTPEHDWFQELAAATVKQQNADGSWPSCNWGSPTICTTWALLSLEPFVPPSPTAIDIRPGSCPNPLNTKENGLLPVAIVGLPDFDVTKIDPASVTLFRKSIANPTKVAPLRWSMELAAIPNKPFAGRVDARDCLAYDPDQLDGYLDLSLKFDAQAVIAALGDVSDQQVVILLVTGKLKEEFGGTGFVGEDVVLIRKN